MCRQDAYKDNPIVLDELLAHVVDDIDHCCRVGVRLKCGSQLHLIPLGNKGDWSYLVLGEVYQTFFRSEVPAKHSWV